MIYPFIDNNTLLGISDKMKLEELESMKYGDLLKLAKEKLNITRRVAKVRAGNMFFVKVLTLNGLCICRKN